MEYLYPKTGSEAVSVPKIKGPNQGIVPVRRLCFLLLKSTSQLVKKQQVTKRPNWRYPGQVQGEFKKSSDSKPAEENTRNQTSGQISYCPSENCVESFGVSEILTLVRTPDDEYFGEFHGPNLPDEVVLGNEGINFPLFC